MLITSILVLLMIPATAIGAYFAYTQARLRVAELNQITPLEDTDLGQVARLALNLETAEAESSPQGPDLTPSPRATPVPTLALPGTENQGADTSTTAELTPPIEASGQDTTTAAPVEAAALSEPANFDPRRVTILLMGIDQREGETGQFRTDTLIVLSIDPAAKTGAMLSIPRDLWVEIPGTRQQGRINTANFVGDSPDLNFPGGGPALAMLTVERLIGQRIDHYMLVNFDAFTTLINVVGNIEICVAERIDDPKYPDGSYGFLPIVIEPGCQDMDGPRLLQYARTRATPGGDFDRAKRQQEVILAVRSKVLTAGGVRALLGDSLTLWESLSDNIKTDLTLDEIINLALLAGEVNDIRSGTISTQEVLEGLGPDGSQILIPIQTDIFNLVADLFRPPNRPAAASEQVVIPDPNNVPLTVREEAPIIAVLNGTSIQGRARTLGDFILTYNLDVDYVGNAPEGTGVVESYIVYYGDHAVSAEYLSYVLATINGNNIPPVQRGEGRPAEGDVFVILGTDLSIPQQ
jgi:LCP family protein required for cell wall assembly